jgi:hypothetical protein
MSWLHRSLGKDGASQWAIDSSFAGRVSQRPSALGATGGAYSLSVTSGVMAAGLAANSEIFQFRWVHATFAQHLRSIRIEAGNAGTAFAAGVATFTATVARSWSADGTGGTAITFGTNDQKKRTSFPTTKAPSGLGVRCASTAALGAGTKTLDGNAFAGLTCGVLATAGTTILTPGTYLWERNTGDEYPFYYLQNEGFVIRATVPATGTWTFNVDLEWSEIDPAVVDGW